MMVNSVGGRKRREQTGIKPGTSVTVLVKVYESDPIVCTIQTVKESVIDDVM